MNQQPDMLGNNTQQTNRVRGTPISDIDMQYRTIDPTWGKTDVPQELRDKLSYIVKMRGENGGEKYLEESLWGLLGYYSRDMRMANLSKNNNEFGYCQYYLDLAGDCLREGYLESFLTALSRVITVLELSQSKEGFFRKMSNTFRSEQTLETTEHKKSLMNWGKREQK